MKNISLQNLAHLYLSAISNTTRTDFYSSTASHRFLNYIIILPVICSLGIPINLCVVAVLRKRSEIVLRINTLLLGLAAFDTILLLSAIYIFPVYAACVRDKTWRSKESTACPFLLEINKYIYPLSMVGKVGSVWISAGISLDRYLIVCHPLLVKSKWTVTIAKRVLLGVLLLSILYCLPTAFHFEKRVRFTTWYRTVYQTYLYFFVLIIIPVAIMLVLNGLCIRELKSAGQRNRYDPEHQIGLAVAERRVTIIAIYIVGSFIIFNTPAFLIRFAKAITVYSAAFWTPGHRTSSIPSMFYFDVKELVDYVYANAEIFTALLPFKLAQMISNNLVLLNSATNFLIYYLFSGRFRRAVAKTLTLPCTHKKTEKPWEEYYEVDTFCRTLE